MLFQWNAQSIAWMRAGAEYTGFYEKLAALLLPYIRRRESLCDLGCGMALADFALTGEIGRITCVDIDAEALDFVKRHAAETGTRNLSVVQSDGFVLQGRWDTVMTLFHSRVQDMCYTYLDKARDRLIHVTHGAGAAQSKPCSDAAETAAWLDERGFVYEKRLGELEFGQPFRSPDDAAAWLATFRPQLPEEERRRFFAENARETGRSDYPWFLPKTRRFGIFVIPRAENEHLLQ